MATNTITPTTPLKKKPATWFEVFRSHGYYFHYAAVITLIFGIYLHVTRLFIGNELFLKDVFTPGFDMVLALPMTYAGIFGWLSWKKVDIHGRGRVLLTAGLCYFSLSIPLHVYTYISQSTNYVSFSPVWYSYVILPIMLLLAFFFARLHFLSND